MYRDTSIVGKGVPLREGTPKVTGAERFVPDRGMTGALWMKILRSPHPHARIRNINTVAAEALPGVRAILTHKDVPTKEIKDVGFNWKGPILPDRVRFVGDEVLIERLEKTGKVILLVNAEIKEIKGKKFVEGLVYEDLITGGKKELAVRGVFISIGQIPNNHFVVNFLKLNEYNEIMIDCRTTQSSVPGVFAAGDVANLPFKQYIIAAGEGAKAALAAHQYIHK